MTIPTDLIESLPEPVLVFKGGDVSLAWMNSAAEYVLRGSLEKLRGADIASLAAGFDTLKDVVEITAKTGETIRGSGLQFRVASGRHNDWSYIVFPHQNNIAVMLTAGQNPLGLESDKAPGQAVSMLGRMLAHELKNPLAGIHGAAQLLESGLSHKDDLEITDLIKSEVERIGRLADKMESFGDIENTDFEVFNIHTVLRKAFLLFQSTDKTLVTLVENYDPSLPDVLGNPDQLMQVVVNLLANAMDAVKASAHGNRIEIRTVYRSGIRKKNTDGELLSLPVEIQIIDNGDGISDDLKQRVFQPFVTGKANGQGLGLALVAKIVMAHGGLVELRTGSENTIFSVLLPTPSS